MRTFLVTAALAAAPLAALVATPALAECEPRYRPLCTNECQTRPPDVKDPLEYFGRVCPD
ncbi:MAG TPA: hypothetical protein VNA20_06635 [Frankiaceae bacterium]|nr:hypothetical protein [Frankiaceae bacterium]